MFLRIAVLATVVVSGALAAAADAHPQQYLISVHLKQKCASNCEANNSTKILAAPKIVTVEGRQANYLVGGEKKIGDELVEFGTTMQVFVHSAGNDSVAINGKVEVSNIATDSDELLTRKSTAIHFKRTVELGKTTRFDLPDASGGKQSLEISIEKVTALPPDAVVPDDAGPDVPRPLARGATAVRR